MQQVYGAVCEEVMHREPIDMKEYLAVWHEVSTRRCNEALDLSKKIKQGRRNVRKRLKQRKEERRLREEALKSSDDEWVVTEWVD